MASYRELLGRSRRRSRRSLRPTRETCCSPTPPLFVDVREPDEWEEGHIPHAIHVPRGWLEARIEGLVPDKSRPLVIYCSGGRRRLRRRRSARWATRTRSISPVASRTGSGRLRRDDPSRPSRRAAPPDSRHLLIPEVGEDGQQRSSTRACFWSAQAGSASPAALYLAAAGVGTLGIVDADVVDESNLQRQIIHRDGSGEPKVHSAKRTIEALNPDVLVRPFEALTLENADRSWAKGGRSSTARQLPDSPPRERRVDLARDSGRTVRSSASRARCSPPGPGPATACSPSLLPSWRRAAPREASSESCPASSARCRRARR